MSSRTRQRLAAALGLGLTVAGLQLVTTPVATANPAGTGLVINEVYGGGGNGGAAFTNDFVELHNPSASPISVNGLSLQYRSSTSTAVPGSSNILALPNKTVQPGGYFLVQLAAGNTVTDKPLPTPDAQSTGTNMALSGTTGQIYLASGTVGVNPGTGTVSNASVIDFVGWGAATSFEGTGPAPGTANATSISRKTAGSPAVVQDTDSNSADFATAAAPTPTTTSVAEPLAVTDPGNKSVFVGAPLTINLTATGGTPPYSWQSTLLPAGLSLTGGQISGTPSAIGSTEVTVTATDAATPTAGTASKTFTIEVTAAPDVRAIAEIQGTGARSPLAPATGNNSGTTVVATEGVVTAAYPVGGFNGLYIQTPGVDTADASDAIFVYGGTGNANIPAGIAVGDSVRVTGPIAEFYNLTQIVPASGGVTKLGSSLGTVTPRAVAFPATDAERERLEGELLAPTGAFTVSNSYSTNQYAEVGLATGTTPLKQMTEFAAPSDAAAIQAIKDENYARAVVLDDGSTTNYLQNQTTKGLPVPYLTKADGSASSVRVGAGATFNAPVVLDWRNDVWKFQPQGQVTTNGADVVTFEDTRASNLVPQNVGGDLKIATFNVLNYFNTTGEAYALAGPQQNPPVATTCTYYTDRQSNRIGNNTCGVRNPDGSVSGSGPRGAATAESLARQEEKLTNTLLALDAEVIGLEEVENSIKLPGETNRDDAVIRIVQLLNAQSGPGTWGYVRSPGSSLTSAAVAEQDVIRPAFIYQTEAVEAVGQSEILFGTSEFANAREPLAQAFKAKGAPDKDAFAVIVNHFKSKGDNADPAPPATGDNKADDVTGVGAFNGDRKRQAERLVEFADDFAAARDIDAVFLAGDFNSYTKEEPIQVLEAGGFELIESDQPNDESYSYSGLSGSLDHVLGNEAAMAMVTGADIWEINANESPAFQYSRFNYNVTNFWQPELPFGTSDHNPEIVGINVPDFTPTEYQEIQVLGTNDFHGRLLPDAGNAAGAAPFATAVKELKAENPNSVFVAAGDLVGASTFESFIQDDEPTIDALNAMGLEVSAVGNHEFDRGYTDLVDRILPLANWEYLATNVQEPAGQPDKLAETWVKEIDGKRIGFVGAVTEDLPALVNPAGIQGVTVTDVVDATNAAAAGLRSGPNAVDLVVLLVHEGSPSTDCSSSSFTDPAGTWGNIVQNTSADVDAIISGHTHLAYNCRFPVADWVSQDRAVTKRPVVSAGQYGTNLNKLVFKYDTTSDELVAVSQDVIATAGVGYAPDPAVQTIVQSAVDYAAVEGAKPLGKMDGRFDRATYQAQGTPTENRGGESTLSNQVAEVQRWATEQAGIDTDLALMNPGGLRADMPGTADGELRSLSYRQAADVQPFANTLVNLQLTGAQLEEVLEEQWQRNALGGVPSRPFLRLGTSAGFTYTYTEKAVKVEVPNAAPVDTFEGEITGMWLDGEPVDPAETYSVTVNSFLGSGGDNFWTLADGADKVDTGKVDLEAMVDYMARFKTTENPLAVDYSQRGVKVTFPADAPEAYAPGEAVKLNVASWSMSAADDLRDTQLQVKLGDEVLGVANVDNAAATTPYDNMGTASVNVPLPTEGLEDGPVRLTLVGATTKTAIPVDITVDDGEQVVQVLATNDFHGRIPQTAANGEGGAAVLAGAVKQLRAQNPNTVFAAAGDLIGASTFDSFVQRDKPTIDALNEAGLDVSAVGNHELDGGYTDLIDRVMADYDAEDNPLGGAEWQYIAANLKMKETGNDAVPATFMQEFGNVQIGFVGAVTEDLPSLVNPDGIAQLDVLDIVDSVNAEATELKADGADAVIMLVHEGAPSTACAPQNQPGTTWGDIVTGVNADVDAIVSGHTHLAYSCSFPVAAWADRPVKERPVVSAGQYGMNLNQLQLTFDNDAKLQRVQQALLPLMGPDPDGSGPGLPQALYPADLATKQIVDAAVAAAEPIGAEVLGKITAPFSRAKYSNGTENRGSSSTAGNLIAEVQRWATPERLDAQIAFMNPGGIRGDMVGSGSGTDPFPRDLTYRQAANVQSFANSLINMKLTGDQIKAALEQQWQRTTAGAVPTRAFLRLGVSEGFTYTYAEVPDTSPSVPAGTKKGVVTGMWLDGEPLVGTQTYSVTVNSFLSPGGDNFRAFAAGTQKTDWGMTDLQSMVDYFDEFGSGSDAIEPAYDQRAVQVQFPEGAPASYQPGGTVSFDLAALAMTGSAASVTDKQDTQVEVFLGDVSLGKADVNNTVGSAPDNNTTVKDAGKASVAVDLPDTVAAGRQVLTIRGATTGTVVRVPVQVAAEAALVASDDTVTWGEAASIDVAVTGNDGAATGTVTVLDGETELGSTTLTDGEGAVTIAAKSVEPGTHELTAVFDGEPYGELSDELVLTVTKATSAIAVDDVSLAYGRPATVRITVDPAATGTVQVRDGARILGSAAVAGGVATVTLPARSLEPGRRTLTAAYAGDGHYLPASTSLVATVAKATSRTNGSVKPQKVVVKRTRATVTVVVTGASGVKATGKVKISVTGQGSKTVTVRNGRATLKLKRFTSSGKKRVTIQYLGSDLLLKSSDKLTFIVRKR